MSDTVKLIIEIPKSMYENVQNGTYCGTLYEELKNGVPLDDVKAEIQNNYYTEKEPSLYQAGTNFGLSLAIEILDNIGKAESEVTE